MEIPKSLFGKELVVLSRTTWAKSGIDEDVVRNPCAEPPFFREIATTETHWEHGLCRLTGTPSIGYHLLL